MLDDYDYEPSLSANDPLGWGQTIGGDFNGTRGVTRGAGIIGVNGNEIRYANMRNNNYGMNNNNNNNFGVKNVNFVDNNNGLNVGRQPNKSFNPYSNDLAESFLSYCIEWVPPFEGIGIHPYLLQGLLQNDIEHKTFRVLIKVLTTKMDKLADRSSARPCLCIVAVLPYMYYIIRFKPEYFATISQSLFESLIILTSGNGNTFNNPYSTLKKKFEY